MLSNPSDTFSQTQLKRSLVRSLLKARKFDDKIILTKSALLAITLQPYHTNFFSKQLKPKTKKMDNQDQVLQRQIGVQTEVINYEQPQKPQKQNLFKETNYFKQTSQTFTQTDLIQTNSTTYFCQNTMRQINLSQSIIFSQNSQHKLENPMDETICSFTKNTSSFKGFFKCKNHEGNSICLQRQVQGLSKQITSLKTQIQNIGEQKNKWKKKAEKYSNKLKNVQKQMNRFEAAYTKKS